MKNLKEDDELKECTFKPVRLTQDSESKTRTKEEFLESQKKFLQQKQDNLKKVYNQMYEQQSVNKRKFSKTMNE